MTQPNMPSNLTSREYLRIGGGYGVPETGESPAGGLDIDNAGNLATDGDMTIDGALDLKGGEITNTTGDLALNADTTANGDLKHEGRLVLDIADHAIASGAITVSGSFARVAPESGSTDNLDTINGGVSGALLVLRPAASNTIILKHATGNIKCPIGSDTTLQYKRAILLYDASQWYVLAVQE